MTKQLSDKSTRNVAIPFVATPFIGLSESGGLFFNIDAARIISDDLIVVIRCCTPRHANLVEAHLNMQITVASATTVKIGIGRWSGYQAVTPTEAEINASHKILAGTDTAFASSAGTLFIDGLNLLPQIPRRGDATFNEDGFVIIMKFSRSRTGDTLKKFEPICSALMGLI